MNSVTVDTIRHAATILSGLIVETPTIPSPTLSQRVGAEMFFKLENLQFTSSFKVRGAAVKLASLTEAERARGVIAASAGNHAQGVARHASLLGIKATIVMPRGTPFTKVHRTEAWGARVVLKGANFDEAYHAAMALSQETGAVFVHPYDDAHVIAGQGTIGLEMLAAVPDFDVLVIPIGGGGLISGTAIAAKAINPAIRIFGVQSAAFPSMKQVLAGLPVVTHGATVAEGIAVKQPGFITRDIIAALVEDIIIVDEAALEEAIHLLAVEQKIVAEGAGAAGLAACLRESDRFAGLRVGTIVCGGNIDDRLLASILLRGLIREGKMARLRIELPDQPGALVGVSQIVAEAGANIIEVTHHRLTHDVPIKRVTIDLVIEARDQEHTDLLIATLEAAGYPTEKMNGIS
jgi:threonine dehydratase